MSIYSDWFNDRSGSRPDCIHNSSTTDHLHCTDELRTSNQMMRDPSVPLNLIMGQHNYPSFSEQPPIEHRIPIMTQPYRNQSDPCLLLSQQFPFYRHDPHLINPMGLNQNPMMIPPALPNHNMNLIHQNQFIHNSVLNNHQPIRHPPMPLSNSDPCLIDLEINNSSTNFCAVRSMVPMSTEYPSRQVALKIKPNYTNSKRTSNRVSTNTSVKKLAPFSNFPKAEEIIRRARPIKIATLDPLRFGRNSKTVSETVVIYWMVRELRTRDNYSLAYAQMSALEHGVPLIVYYSPMHSPFYSKRQHVWRLKGLIDVQEDLSDKGIPFVFETNKNWPVLKHLLLTCDVMNLITDHYPVKEIKNYRDEITSFLPSHTTFEEVDAHNVAPSWRVSDKHEPRAFVFRQRLVHAMETFKLQHLPPALADHHKYSFKSISDLNKKFQCVMQSSDDINHLIEHDTVHLFCTDPEVEPITWAIPGQTEAYKRLQLWCTSGIAGYSKNRNDPNAAALSSFSIYFNHGFLSPHAAIRAVDELCTGKKADKERFINEALVWRELSDNFTLFNSNYDNINGFPSWATQTQLDHADDHREWIYTLDEFENAKTHDRLWNAAQQELIVFGKIHSYLRLYWAKMILEWSKNVEEALRITIYLNDKWSLDGCDPNGYNGCMWSIGGVHDRAFPDRPIYGKIRCLTLAGVERKFDINMWCSKMEDSYEKFMEIKSNKKSTLTKEMVPARENSAYLKNPNGSSSL